MMEKKLLGLFALCIMQLSLYSDIPAEPTRYQMADTISIDDLDALEDKAEETHAFDTIEVKPPSPLMIRLRKIGMPILIMLLNAKKHLHNAWDWIVDVTADPICPDCHKRH